MADDVVRVNIVVEVDPRWADSEHPAGISSDAYDRLTGADDVHEPSLSWLGEVQEVEKREDD